jgi:hypothetical protein
MSRTKVALYSFALDGGTGAIILRGTKLLGLEGYLSCSLMTLAPLSFGAGVTLDFGWIALPSGLLVGVDPSYFGAPPALEIRAQTVNYPSVHFAAPEPVLMTVNGGVLTSGELVLLLEAVRP